MARERILKTAFNNYYLIEKKDEGGAGTVFKAKDEDDNIFAIKILDPRKATSDKKKRFKNEILFCFKNKHPNIVTAIDFGNENESAESSPFYVMPFFENTLRNIIQKGIESGSVLYYFSQILDGIEAAHMVGVWHRDLKPENIMFDSDNNKFLIGDFGIAHFKEELLQTTVETAHHSRLANFQYAAPEQRTKGEKVTHLSDIYSLGLILNEMFTGSVPHGTSYKTIATISPEYSYIDGIVEKMIRQNPSERYSSIEQIKNELIAKKNEFISQQKLSKIKNTVIPESEIDDPLALDPIRIVGVDYQYGNLILKFQQPVNREWIDALKYMGTRAIMGKGPERFRFKDNTASIDAKEAEVQRVVDYFKEWIPKANARYLLVKQNEKRNLMEQQKAELQKQKKEEELRLRILDKIKI